MPRLHALRKLGSGGRRWTTLPAPRKDTSLLDIVAHAGRVGARRLILTHMSREMLACAADVPEQCAHDGLVVSL